MKKGIFINKTLNLSCPNDMKDPTDDPQLTSVDELTAKEWHDDRTEAWHRFSRGSKCGGS